ncbi:CaiB/BaiF CoA transferase family protein [Chloroflexota bacterium]
MTAGGVLSAYSVLDFTDGEVAFCAKLLGDMGARVTRLEMVGEGALSPDPAAERYLNSGKEKVSLELATEAGVKEFRRLVGEVDVLVENKRPGYLAGLGLGYPQLSEINPRLVMVAITGFGQSGPYRDYQSCPLVAAAMGGWLSVCGSPESPPLQPFGNQAHYFAALFAANGILLALWARQASGRGQYLDISVMESVTAALDHVLVRYLATGEVAQRQGSLYWNSAFRLFPCQDGYVLLSLQLQWETLVAWLESEGMADDLNREQYRQPEERVRHLEHVIAVLERWTLKHTAGELVERGQLMRFPWAKVMSLPELLNCPQLLERGFFLEAEDASSGRKYKFPGLPWKAR